MIDIKNVYFSYTGTKPYVLNNINLSIKDGTYTSVLGDNGSGKSTLIKLILGLLNPIDGKIITNTNNIGYVPQKLDGFNSGFPLTVSELLNCHRKILKLHNQSIIYSLLDKVGMQSFEKSLIGSLSQGQLQKIFIARALMGNPKLLILDEPSTGVDIESQKDIYKTIKELNTEKSITILSIEHNIAAALENSTHILTVKKGECKMYDIYEYKSKSSTVSLCNHNEGD